MSKWWVIVLLVSLACGVKGIADSDAPAKPLAITHVTVLDGTGAAVLPDMTVVITGERITALGKSGTIAVPDGATMVDGHGKFLIPGLWDMHVHTVGKFYLPLFLANGVTGVRDMGAFIPNAIFAMRKEVKEGKLLGPRMVVAGPIVDGPKPFWPGSLSVTNAKEGTEAVRSVKKSGADFVKVYSKLPRDAYLAIMAEARLEGIPAAGHVPESVSAAEASDLGQKSIEHLTGISMACARDEDKLRADEVAAMAKVDNAGLRSLIMRSRAKAEDSYDPQKAAALFARLAKNGTWQTPTLTVLRSLASLDDPAFTKDPRVKYMPTYLLSGWGSTSGFMKMPAEISVYMKATYKKAFRAVREMHKAGVPFLAGTDVTNPYVFPGFSLHDELGLLVDKCGFTPAEALRTATSNPARYLGMEKDLGTVEQGKLADLVLLEANPLDDIRNTTRIAAVIANGKLLTRSTLDKMMADVAASNHQLAPAKPGKIGGQEAKE